MGGLADDPFPYPSFDQHEDIEQQASPSRPSWRIFWCEEISSRSLIPPLLVVTAVCGLLDATTYT